MTDKLDPGAILNELMKPQLLPSGGSHQLCASAAVANGDNAAPPLITTLQDAEGPKEPSYSFSHVRADELSISAAIDAKIPLAGGAGGSMSRRVVVLETVGYNTQDQSNGDVHEVGYAVRLCLTVSRLEAQMSISLPMIAASAQLGKIEASWSMQVVGLHGQILANVGIVPVELNVETFVVAKQKLAELVGAIYDASTEHRPTVIRIIRSEANVRDGLARSVIRVAALRAIERRRTLRTAIDTITRKPAEADDITETYRLVAGTSDPNAQPTPAARAAAAELLAGYRL